MKKKILSLFLASLLTFSLCAPVLAEQAQDAPGESDLPVISDAPEPEASGEVTPSAAPASPPAEPTSTPETAPSSSQEPSLPPDSEMTPSPVPVPTPEPTSPESDILPDPKEPEQTVPSSSPESDQSPQPEEILLDEQEPGLVLTQDGDTITELTVNHKRSIKITVSCEPAAKENIHITWSSSNPAVATAAGTSTNANTGNKETLIIPETSGDVYVYPVGLGETTITGTGTSTKEPTNLTVTFKVTVTGEGSTLGKSLSEIQNMPLEDVLNFQVYDGRDLGIMSDVNYQKSGNCVAQGYAAMIETSMRKQGFSQDLDLDVDDLTYRFYHHQGDPLGNTQDDGQSFDRDSGLGVFPLAAFLNQWNGPVPSGSGGHNVNGFEKNAAKPREIVFLSQSDGIDTIKQFVVQYGAVTFTYANGNNADSLYYWTNSSKGHYNTIVGWDDTVSASEFGNHTTKDGAWIVKDSAGENSHSTGKGYFYLSYDSATSDKVVLAAMPPSAYQNNYFYDGKVPFGENDLQYTQLQAGATVAASFKAKCGTEKQDEYLEAVNIGIAVNGETSLDVEVYTHVKADSLTVSSLDPLYGIPEPSAKCTKTISRSGFYTIPLPNRIKLKNDEYFTVAVRVSNACSVYVSQEDSRNDLTFIHNGTWETNANRPVRLKAFTNLHNTEDLDLPDLTSLALDKSTLEMPAGASEHLTVTFDPVNAKDRSVSWESSDPSIVSVDEYGTLTAISQGTATITVTGTNNIQASCEVTVTDGVPVESLTLNKTTLTLTVGQSETLTAEVLPENATDRTVTWSSDSEAIAAVDSNGKVTALAVGTATVTAAAGGHAAQCTVTVLSPLPVVTPTASASTTEPGQTAKPESTDKPAPSPTDTNPEETAPPEPPVTSEPFETPTETSNPSGAPGENVVLDAVSQAGAPKASASVNQQALADAALEPEEKDLMEEGESVVFRLDVRDAGNTVSDGDKAAVLSALSNLGSSYQVGEYLDITLSKQIGNRPSVLITDTKEVPVTLVLTVPESLRSPGRTFSIVRVHGTSSEVLPDRDTQPDTITVETDLFSTYAIVYTDQKISPAPTTPTSMPLQTEPAAPNTGDPSNTALWAGMLGFCLLSLAVLCCGRRKGREKHPKPLRFLSLLLALVLAAGLSVPGKAAESDELLPETVEPVTDSTQSPTESPVPSDFLDPGMPSTAPAPTDPAPSESPDAPTEPDVESSEAPSDSQTAAPEATNSPEPTVAPESSQAPDEDPSGTEDPVMEPTASPEVQPIAEIPENGSLTMNITEITFKTAHRTVLLQAVMEPYNYDWKKISWTSSDESVAALSNTQDAHLGTCQATVRAVGPGTAVVTATAEVTGWSASCTVTVSKENSTWGMSLGDIQNMSTDAIATLDVYDGRDLNIMTEVNLQNDNTCVGEGHIAALETSMVRQGIQPVEKADIDGNQLKYHYFNHAADPLGNTAEDAKTGNDWHGPLNTAAVANYITQWNGPVGNFENLDTQTPGYGKSLAKAENILLVPAQGISRQTIKQLVAQYGAVVIDYHVGHRQAQYHLWNSTTTYNMAHCSTIVGWDDTVEMENFNKDKNAIYKATEDGGWIVKNSWGADSHGDGKGYFYLSYAAPFDNYVIAYDLMDAGLYANNYFYDGRSNCENVQILRKVDAAGEGIYAASFAAQLGDAEGQDEYLQAVNVAVDGATTIQVDIYTQVEASSLTGETLNPLNGSLQSYASVSQSVGGMGFYTVPLAQPVKLQEGEYFTVAVKLTDGAKMLSVLGEASTNDLTFYTTGNGWSNPNGESSRRTLHLKAFTNLHEENAFPTPVPTPTSAPLPTPTASPTPTVSPTPAPSAGTETPTPGMEETPGTTSPVPETTTPEPVIPTEVPVLPTDTPAAEEQTFSPPATSEPFNPPAETIPPMPENVDVQVTSAPEVPDVSIPEAEKPLLADTVLTEEEKQSAQQGEPVRIDLVVRAAEPSQEEEAQIQSCLQASCPGYSAGTYVNISLYKQVGQAEPKAIPETKSALTVIISVPENLRMPGRTYQIIRVHGGETSVLQDLDNYSDTITIATNQFSTYAIVYRDAEPFTPTAPGQTAGPSAVPPQTGPASPQTGDTSQPRLYGSLLILCFACLGVVWIRRLKKTHGSLFWKR